MKIIMCSDCNEEIYNYFAIKNADNAHNNKLVTYKLISSTVTLLMTIV